MTYWPRMLYGLQRMLGMGEMQGSLVSHLRSYALASQPGLVS